MTSFQDAPDEATENDEAMEACSIRSGRQSVSWSSRRPLLSYSIIFYLLFYLLRGFSPKIGISLSRLQSHCGRLKASLQKK